MRLAELSIVYNKCFDRGYAAPNYHPTDAEIGEASQDSDMGDITQGEIDFIKSTLRMNPQSMYQP